MSIRVNLAGVILGITAAACTYSMCEQVAAQRCEQSARYNQSWDAYLDAGTYKRELGGVPSMAEFNAHYAPAQCSPASSADLLNSLAAGFLVWVGIWGVGSAVEKLTRLPSRA